MFYIKIIYKKEEIIMRNLNIFNESKAICLVELIVPLELSKI